MFQSAIARSLTAVGAAALAAGCAVFLTSAAPPATAAALEPTTIALHQPVAKSDRLPVLAKGAECSARGWPHYEQSCQYDLRRAADDGPKVRVLNLNKPTLGSE